MNYLFIDTAEGTRTLLKLGAEERYFYDENMARSGSETLMPMIDGLLTEAGVRLSDIDVFGACVGPGSFTGLRIGLTTVKTFCYVLGKKCFGVNNLRLNSYNNDNGKVVSVADAGNKVCYIAAFDGESETVPTKCVSADDAQRIVSELTADGYALSTDVKLSTLAEKFGGKSGIGENEMRIAAEKFAANAVDQIEIEPLYVRKAQPERGEGDL